MLNSNNQNKKYGIIFDLDGTLWDIQNRTYNNLNEIIRKYGIEEVTKDTVSNAFGLGTIEVAKKYFPNIPLEEALKVMDEFNRANIESLKTNCTFIYPDVIDTIKKLSKKYKLYIVTNAGYQEYPEAFLISSNLNKYFDDYIAASAFNMKKNEAIKKIIKDYKLTKAIYVGDTLKDKESAEINNIPFIHAKYGFNNSLKADYSIDSFKYLPIMVDSIFMQGE